MGWEPDYEAMFIADTMNFLRWAWKRADVPARIPETPINFYQAQRMMAYGEKHDGPLFESRKAEGFDTFVWSVSEAGFTFMRKHGWTESEVEIPKPKLPKSIYKDGGIHYPPLPKSVGEPVTSIWKLDRNRRIDELNPWKAPDEVREKFADGSNRVMVVAGELYAASFEELIGSDVDILFHEQ